MSFSRFYDPEGTRYGLPSWPWGWAPAHLATRAQLAARGLRPGGREPVGQVTWRSRRAPKGGGGIRFALLYDTRLALPKRTPSAAVLASLERAMAARRTCPTCRTIFEFCIPTSLGECPDCHTAAVA
ncbi:RRQRL motif-containing zinc-binding protein [Nocardiopsis baichengensis]|uniref:RRQRL motif-containing zinc-binding protein n=1 Tax=Nocardiopsis baichengensis TaxID=280240 RepID=UPI0003482DDE|nr:RRQRL motif-containing zinc-binding protein [Nocardiopsis baichengensis]